VLALVITGFLFHSIIHVEAATIALLGASLHMLLAGHEEVEKFFEEVEWGTIFFFAGLFILVGGLVEVGIIKTLSEKLLSLTGGNLTSTSIIILWGSGILSAIVDNIPYVATMIPLIKNFGANPAIAADPALLLPIWWSLALGACLGGNGTLIGASANVVSAGIAGKNGYKISFLEFTKYGAVITIVNLVVCSFYIYFRYF